MKMFLLISEFVLGIVLITAILLHSPKGEGLGSIGGQAQMFNQPQKGLEAGLNRFTYIVATLFFVIAAVLGLYY